MDTAVMPDRENAIDEKAPYSHQPASSLVLETDRKQHKFWVVKQGMKDDWEDGDDL